MYSSDCVLLSEVTSCSVYWIQYTFSPEGTPVLLFHYKHKVFELRYKLKALITDLTLKMYNTFSLKVTLQNIYS